MILLALFLALVVVVAVIGVCVEFEPSLAALGITAMVLLTVVVVLGWLADQGVLA